MSNTIHQNNSTVILPFWLDDFIYSQLGATYCKRNQDMVILEWNCQQILEYLGTYFPRSFAEGYTIFQKLIKDKSIDLITSKNIRVLDFGCGTGGELVGAILALNNASLDIENIHVKALDGNSYSIKLLEDILAQLSSEIKVDIIIDPCPTIIDDFYDLSTIDKIIGTNFDFIILSKVVCEFATKQQFDEINPYLHIIEKLLKKLKSDGLLYVSDITSYNKSSQKWLGNMMNEAINKVEGYLLLSNEGVNEAFTVSHSRKKQDVSKIAWRILRPQNNVLL